MHLTGDEFLALEPTNEVTPAPYAGTWGIACKEPGEAVEFTGHDGVAFSQPGEGTGRELGLDAEVQGLEYELLGLCGEGRTATG